MRKKYIEEQFKRFIIFGTHSNGNVDLHNGTDDVKVNIPKEEADRIIAERDIFVDTVVEYYMKNPNYFLHFDI